jgi:hypothetical protein
LGGLGVPAEAVDLRDALTALDLRLVGAEQLSLVLAVQDFVGIAFAERVGVGEALGERALAAQRGRAVRQA